MIRMRCRLTICCLLIVIMTNLLVVENAMGATGELTLPESLDTDKTETAERHQKSKTNEASALLKENDFDAVIDLYQTSSLADLAPSDAFLLGSAFYRKQDFSSAIQAFQRAATSPESELACNARFNVGNSKYATALRLLESPPPESASENSPTPATEVYAILRSAIDDFRYVIRENPADDNARYNLELAANLLQQQQQQHNDSDSDSDQDQSPEGESSTDSSENSAEESSSQNQQSEQQPQGDKQQENQPDTTSDQEPDQASSGNSEPEGSSDASQPEAQTEQPANQSANQESSAPNQPEGDQELNETRPSDTPTDKPNSTNPNDVDEGNADENDGISDSPQSDETNQGNLTSENLPATSNNPAVTRELADEPIGMTADEARKLLQSIRDRQMSRRTQLKLKSRMRSIPVEKDW